MSVVKFENEEEVRRSVAEVQRKDSVSGWVLVGYTSPTTLKMLGKGPGGVDEFLHLLQDDQIMYVLLRTLVSELRAEISVKITKDVLVTWVGPKVGKIERGKKNEHTGDVLTVLHPVHTHLTALTKVGFTDAKVRELTDAAAGSHVIKPADPSVELQTFISTVEADEEKRRQFAHNVISSEKKKATAAGTESRKMSAITLDAADRVQQEVATLLDRATPKGWVLLKYTANTNVTFQASGTGTTAELLPHLADDEIQYILLRLPPDTTENARTLDVFIKWVGPKVGRIVQGKKSEHVADVLSVLHPVHAELTALTKVGFTDDKVRELSVPTAGTHIIKLADQ